MASDMVPVESSNIHSIGYDKDTQTLHVKFRSGVTYHHAGVSPEKHRAFMAAESKGKYFHQHIRGQHESGGQPS